MSYVPRQKKGKGKRRRRIKGKRPPPLLSPFLYISGRRRRNIHTHNNRGREGLNLLFPRTNLHRHCHLPSSEKVLPVAFSSAQEKEDGASTKVPPLPSSAKDANAEDYNQGVGGGGGGGFQATARMMSSRRSDMEVHFVVLLLLLLLWSGPSDGGGAKVGGSVSSSSSSSRCRWARDGEGTEEGGGGGGELECTIITPSSSSSAESLKVPLGSSASPRTLTVRCPKPQRPLQGDRDSQIRKENATNTVNSPVRSGEGGSSYSDLRAVLEAALSLVQEEEDENAWRHLRHLRFSGCAVRRLRRADLLFAASSLGGAGAVHSLAVEGVPVPMELDEVRTDSW